ncbi:MAG TPA: hypothetical protein VKA01_16265 [Vicinamibacteria bacterium]|nr:hypothetical protein [Vicinamibacteria bacterium]
MSFEKADHHDAGLVLRVYEQRREPVMRESRAAILQRFWPKAYEDVQAVLKGDHPLNAAYRQVNTYWEMVYGMVKHRIVQPEYFMESNGEGLFLFARIEPHLEALRRDVSPFAYQNSEWVARETHRGRAQAELFRARVRKMLESK